jgi:hypothetical protein
MNLTHAQTKVLEVLYDDHKKFNRLLGPGSIGEMVWAGGNSRQPQAYARTAGKVLNALQTKGLASYSVEDFGFYKNWGWGITDEGVREFEELKRGKKTKDKKGHGRLSR